MVSSLNFLESLFFNTKLLQMIYFISNWCPLIYILRGLIEYWCNKLNHFIKLRPNHVLFKKVGHMAFNYWLHVEITLSKTKLHPSVLDRTKILNLTELGLSTKTLTCWHQSAPSFSVETRIHWGFIAGAVILLAALAYFVLVKLRHNNLDSPLSLILGSRSRIMY